MDSTIWEQFLTIMRQEAGSRVVDTWFQSLSLTRWDPQKGVVFLTAPNKFVCDWVKQKYHSECCLHLARLFNVQRVEITYLVEGQTPEIFSLVNEPQKTNNMNAAIIPAAVISPKKNSRLARRVGTYAGVNSSMTFDTFVVGPSNSFAHAAMRAVGRNPGSLYNPLFLYGASGLGKTHLLHALGNFIAKKFPDLRVLYQTAERFVHEFIRSIRDNSIVKFKDKYHKIDVLLIDDIQFFAKKDQTQEVFFHIFNTLYDLHKQLIFSSDSSPQDIVGLTDRLRSRFSWGLVADLHAPCLETKMAIIRKKAELHEKELTDCAVQAMAEYHFASVRELEGALIRVLAVATFSSTEISGELVKNVLGDAPEEQQISRPDFEVIIDHVAKEYQCTTKSICSKARSKHIVQARHIAMYLLKTVARMSLREIGKFFNGRDHSTVIHAISSISRQIENNIKFKDRLDRLILKILGQV